MSRCTDYLHISFTEVLKFLGERVPSPGRSLGHFDGAPVLLSIHRHCMHSPSPAPRSLYFILNLSTEYPPPTSISRLSTRRPPPSLDLSTHTADSLLTSIIVSECTARVCVNSMYFRRPNHVCARVNMLPRHTPTTRRPSPCTTRSSTAARIAHVCVHYTYHVLCRTGK